MLSNAEIIGRVTMQTDFEKSDAILSKYRSMAKLPKYVEQIYNDVHAVYSEETLENRRLIFIATVYQIYQPLSFLEKKEDGKVSGKLPVGVRDEMTRCLGFVNPEMVNHYKIQIEPFMKPENNNGMERPFKTKVMRLVERFKPFSINSRDSQYRLGL